MAVAENSGAKIGSSGQNLDNTVVSSDSKSPPSDLMKTKPKNDGVVNGTEPTNQTQKHDHQGMKPDYGGQPVGVNNGTMEPGQMQNGYGTNGVVTNQKEVVSKKTDDGYGLKQRPNGIGEKEKHEAGERYNSEMRDLVEMLSNLNPLAQEFVPPSLAHGYPNNGVYGNEIGFPGNFILHPDSFNRDGNTTRRRKNNNSYAQGKRRMNARTSMAQREEIIRRTVYVSDLDHQVTEEQLAGLFLNCGQVVDCRICGDPNSVLRFAFIEFTDEEGAMSALNLAGTMLGYYPVKVLPSKTAIAPVNPTFLPRSDDEREMCTRTIYCTNIDKKITQADVKVFFESICGEVLRLRLLGDYHHLTRIAFVEFMMAESAIAALNCSGALLGSLPIRVSPSKTPVRPRTPPRTRPQFT